MRFSPLLFFTFLYFSLLSFRHPAFLSLASAEIPVETYTLEDSIRLALLNSGELQSAEQGITIAVQRVREAQFLFLPEVGLQASATRFEARYPFALRPGFRSILLFPSNDPNLFSGQAYMTLSLYEGRRHINTLRLAKTALKQAQSKYEAVKLDIVYNTRKVFYQFIFAQENASAADELLTSLKRFSGAPSDWQGVTFQALGSELRAEASEAQHFLELARLEFLKGLNKELDIPIVVKGRLETTPVEIDLKKALVWATELRPELQSQTYKSQMDAIAVNLALGQRIPTLMLGVDYEVTGQKFPLQHNNWDATIGIRFPLSFDYWTQHTQKLAEQRQGEIARAELHDQVHLEVRKAYKDLRYWQSEWREREKEYQQIKRLSENAKQRLGQNLAALEAFSDVLKVRKRYLKAVLEHILARARLERAVGRPIPGE